MKLEQPVRIFMPVKDPGLRGDAFELTSFTAYSVEDLLELGNELSYDKEDPCIYTDELEAIREVNRLNVDLLRKANEALIAQYKESDEDDDDLEDEDIDEDIMNLLTGIDNKDIDDGEVEESVKEEEYEGPHFQTFSSKLVRFPYWKKIKLCRRRLKDKEGKNCLFITDREVKEFIKDCDCKKSYTIVKNREAYDKWSKFIDSIVESCNLGDNE